MEWLTPMMAVYAAAVSVPLLLLLYFLKLKRREQIVSSTLLWKRAVQDLQVNAPFQRLRRNILLLLQLLMLLAMLFALAGPILSLTRGPGRRYVLLIDRSASMNAADAEPSRLEAAKKQARVFVESMRSKTFLSLSDKSDQTMVIAFDSHANVKCNFTSDKRQLIRAIEAITPGDGDSSLAEAVVVARAFAQSPGVEGNIRSAEEPAQLVLFSDGQIHDLDQVMVGPDELIFHSVGKSRENVAITAMQARRTYENPDEINVFASLANYGSTKITCDVQLSINNDVRAIKSVTIPARKTDSTPTNNKQGQTSEGTQPGKVAVNFSLSHAEAGVLEVALLQSLLGDSLSSDDAAWAILSPPKKLSVLLVTAGNIVLESALRSCPLARLDVNSPAEFDEMDHSALSVQQPYDVIVLDRKFKIQNSKFKIQSEIPRCRYLVFGHPPGDIDVSVPQQLENQVMVDWRPKHPVLQYVNMMNLFAAKCYQMVLPRDAEVLAEFNESPALALVRRNGSVFLLAGFDVLQTNWPFEPSFVLFCYNAASFLGMQIGQNQQTNLQVGQPIIVEGLNPESVARIDGPGFSGVEIKSNSAGSIRFPGTDRVGVYSISCPDKPVRFFAVNLLNTRESDIEPIREIVLSGQPVQAQEQAVTRANLPLWPYLVVLALILACLEWLIYNLKVRI
ncbi:hypothetical protein ES703_29948 [subsurface metagenome]